MILYNNNDWSKFRANKVKPTKKFNPNDFVYLLKLISGKAVVIEIIST